MRRERFAVRLAAAAIAVAAIAAPGRARANGQFPSASQIVVAPTDDQHLAAVTTFGLLVSHDAGLHFDWICEGAVGYGGGDNPSGVAILGDGAVLASLFSGLAVGPGDACTWSFAADLGSNVVTDVSVLRTSPSTAYVLRLGDDGSSGAWGSHDGAATWQPLAPLAANFVAQTLDVAASSPSRLYVSGLAGGVDGALVRSDDAGLTWTTLAIPGSNWMSAPFIAAIDPLDASVVYVRLAGDPGKLVVTHDAGATWQTAFSGPGALTAFALSGDGSEVYTGGRLAGLWRSPTAALAFAQISTIHPSGLAWSPGRLYATSIDLPDHFAIGVSTDDGATFTPLLQLPCLDGPPACDPGSSVASTCPAAWPAIRGQIGGQCGTGGGSASSASASASTGATTSGGGGATASGSSTSTGGAGGAGGSGGAPAIMPAPRSCGCRAAGSDGERDGSAGTALFAAMLIGAARRRVTGRSASR